MTQERDPYQAGRFIPQTTRNCPVPELTEAAQKVIAMADKMRPRWAACDLKHLEAEHELHAIGPEPDLVRAAALAIILLERGEANG